MNAPNSGVVSAPTNNFLYLRISSISRAEFCTKASKILSFDNPKATVSKSSTHAISTGNKLHYQYDYFLAYRSFDGDRCKALLNRKVSKSSRGHPVFTKTLDGNIIIAGMYDSLMVLKDDDGKKKTILLELKSTSKKGLNAGELRSAIKQLQLYMFLLKDHLEEIGYPLFRVSYLEIVSQSTGKFLKRIPIEYDPDIENWIRNLVDQYRGLVKIKVPPYEYCKQCLPQVKSNCDWYRSRRLK